MRLKRSLKLRDERIERLTAEGLGLQESLTVVGEQRDDAREELAEARGLPTDGAQPAEEEGPYDNPYPHGLHCKCGPKGERGEPGVPETTETTYDCGLDESCLDEDGFVKAGGHPLHEPDQEGD